MKTLILFFLILPSSLYCQTINNEWFKDEILDCIFLLEKKSVNGFVSHGTGFLVESVDDKGVIVTCNHILLNDDIFVVVPLSEEFLKIYFSFSEFQKMETEKIFTNKGLIWNGRDRFIRMRFNLIDSSNVKRNKTLDIGVIGYFDFLQYKTKGLSIPLFKAKKLSRNLILGRENLTLGDECYFIGFPFGIGTHSGKDGKHFKTKIPNHLFRKAQIAWLSDDYNEYLLDARSYSGNSGSPVFKIGRKSGEQNFALAGMVNGHLLDTHGDNSGLAKTSFNESILELVYQFDIKK